MEYKFGTEKSWDNGHSKLGVRALTACLTECLHRGLAGLKARQHSCRFSMYAKICFAENCFFLTFLLIPGADGCLLSKQLDNF